MESQLPARASIDAAALRAALGARWPRIEVVEQTGSTNTDLIADLHAPDRSLLVAEDQVAGRGRLERSWVTPSRAGLTFSMLLRPAAPIASWGWLPLLTGVALREAVAEVTGVDAGVKWPNDLLAWPQERKLAGILAQTSGEVVVIGIGLNVSLTADELPVQTATSLLLCGATDLDRTRLLAAIAARVDRRVAQWEDVAGDAEACGLAGAYRAACTTLGRDVVVTTLGGEALPGRAVEIDSDGRLRVEVGGELRTIGAGDVEHVRPGS
ncbi:biotin--[acetyl-CoA-carboxylase] ligase [Jatrophihabitans sp.]|uniref:biotin--[acetyl-CoA-carboxylase] ligase n=1 Tax=Jatrophihabitans sp. TaxID=1932789 RepID=UPI0030C7788B|nr:Biotin-protein ligase [Jatrophihabitans sp.]